MENARVAVIAGGTRGIGLALVAALARVWAPGDVVYLTARKPADGERAAAAACEAAGPAAARFDWLPFDLVDREGADRLARTLIERHGGVDVADLKGAFAPAEDAPPERDARPSGASQPTTPASNLGACALRYDRVAPVVDTGHPALLQIRKWRKHRGKGARRQICVSREIFAERNVFR